MQGGGRLLYFFDHPHGRSAGGLAGLLGGKGAGLAEMTAELGLPVPPGFTLTTEACREVEREGWTPGLDAALRAGLAGLEARAGRTLADPANPLLVSVRSGAPVSMPGMLDTVLNVGATRASLTGLAARGGASFADECREHLHASLRAALGGEPVPEDPWRQLRLAVEAVFRSWHGERARSYRRRARVADDLGTAVSVQAMVFGNLDDASATGVLLTRDPATGEPRATGDLLFRAQGDEVVSGRRRTQPVTALGERLPRAAADLTRAAARLERHLRDLCEIEFTVESGRLWLLQARVGTRSPRAALRIAIDLAEDPAFPVDRAEAVRRVAPLLRTPPQISSARDAGAALVARGLGASPGLATGEIALDPDAAVAAAEAGRPAILVRSETSPEDVRGIAVAAGLLTARGGVASHAAVVARAWGIPAVVGVEALAFDQGDGVIALGGLRLAAGDLLSLDGATGEVFRGRVGGAELPVPEVATLLAWARELGIDLELGEAGAASRVEASAIAAATQGAAPSDRARTGAAPSDRTHSGVERRRSEVSEAALADAIVRALSIGGAATSERLAASLGAPASAVAAALDALRAQGLVEPARPAGLRLGAAGRERAATLLAEERRQLGAARAQDALDRFVRLDAPFKHIVADWQLRARAGAEPIPNDHTDAAYDAATVARLRVHHAEALAWLDALAPVLPRLASYRRRLEAALACLLAGDARFLASPRVDSYHGAWFELHEELIRLAGRTRAEEAAAGRAG